MSAFKPATRHAVKLKLGIMGPSGSGKTYSALRLAAGLCPGGKVAFLDTENGSASLYADKFHFDVLDMHAPFSVQKFLVAVDDAVKAGYDALVIDSISAEWQELLAEKEMLDSRGGNSFTNWGSITKKHEDFKKAFVQAPIHILACMRSKQEYVLQANDKGKQAPVKVGMGAVQREGFEYECSVVFDVDMSHHAKTSKDRTSIFGDEIFQITEETGATLREWLAKGGAPVPVLPAAVAPVTTPAAPVTAPARRVAPKAAPAPAPTNDPAWVDAMAELAIVTLGMPEKTRSALVKSFEVDGPAALPALLEEITAIKSIREPEPTAAEIPAAMEQLQAEAIERKPDVSQEAHSFVDGLDPDTDEQNGGISALQYEALGHIITNNGINREALRAYCVKAGHLLPSAHPTLARLKAAEFVKLRTRLGSKDTCAKVVAIINKTSTATYTAPAV